MARKMQGGRCRWQRSGTLGGIARMKELEAENARLKKMYAEERLKADILQEAISKKW